MYHSDYNIMYMYTVKTDSDYTLISKHTKSSTVIIHVKITSARDFIPRTKSVRPHLKFKRVKSLMYTVNRRVKTPTFGFGETLGFSKNCITLQHVHMCIHLNKSREGRTKREWVCVQTSANEFTYEHRFCETKFVYIDRFAPQCKYVLLRFNWIYM